MSVALADDPADPAVQADVFPASVTITRTSQEDFKSRQLIVWVDGDRLGDLLFGEPSAATSTLVRTASGSATRLSGRRFTSR